MWKEADDAQTEVPRPNSTGRTKTATKNYTEYIQSPSWDLNPEPTAYKKRVRTSQPRRYRRVALKATARKATQSALSFGTGNTCLEASAVLLRHLQNRRLGGPQNHDRHFVLRVKKILVETSSLDVFHQPVVRFCSFPWVLQVLSISSAFVWTTSKCLVIMFKFLIKWFPAISCLSLQVRLVPHREHGVRLL